MTIQVEWFSGFFGIDHPQYELPFVDFNLYSDVPLYIDPYAITKDPSELAVQCHNHIASYFQHLLDAVRVQDEPRIAQLIRGRLKEPNEIHLGVSKSARAGRGIGEEQERRITEALANSYAAKVGLIQSIQELELHIEGVGPDKISDLIANIILACLAEYTEAICNEYGITTRPCAVSGFWNLPRHEWDGGYFNLPVYGTHSYILVPKRFVRRERDMLNHTEFYDKYVLDVIQRELLSADDSLVQTLKNGARRVTKKDIKADGRFHISKAFLSEFILTHPDAIEKYRSDLLKRFAPADPAFWSGKSAEDDPKIQAALNRLDSLPTGGGKDASAYHDSAFSLLQFVFDWALENFEKEYSMDQGRGRIDIIAENYASGGLFAELRGEYNAWSIPIECKNYTADLGNNEFNQMIDRLGPKSSRIGMLFCRSITDRTEILKHQTDRWLRHENLILLFDDQGLTELTNLRLLRDVDAIERRLRLMIREVQFGGMSRGV